MSTIRGNTIGGILLSNNNQYPIVKVPHFISSIRESKPEPATPQIPKPVHPQRKIVNTPWRPTPPFIPDKAKVIENWFTVYEVVGVTLTFSVIFYFGIGIFINHDVKYKFVLLGTFIATLIIKILATHETNENKSIAYERSLKEYELELQQYPQLVKKVQETNDAELRKYETQKKKYFEDLLIYEEHINELNKQINLTFYRNAKLKERLAKLTAPDEIGVRQNVIVGVSENFFIQQLKKELSYIVIKDCVLKFDTDGGYYPDIVLHDPKSNLFIDIEIDEPYVGATGEPIHFIECNDENRDDFFTRNGWVVIRFAEEQIVNNTKQCIDLVTYVTSLVLEVPGNDNVVPLDELVKERLKKTKLCIPQWSKDLAHKMAFTRYRNNYLKQELSEKLPTEILSSSAEKKVKPTQRSYRHDTFENYDDLPF